MKLGNKIPSLDLLHNQEKVSFAFRTMSEIHEQVGAIKDLPHRHDYYTILWATNACGDHYIDYQHFLIKPNRIFFVNPGQVHQVITFDRPEGFVIMFTPEYLQQNMISTEFLTNLGLFSDSAATPPLIVDTKGQNKLLQIVKDLRNAFIGQTPFRNEQLSSYLKLFLIECNNYAPVPSDSNTQGLQSGKLIINKFKSEVELHFTDWHKVNLYAEALHISADYLNSVVKATIGKTAKEFIQHRICLEAKRLGVHTQLSSKEIAFELGFEDPSHFSKFFKSIEGKSFSDFRNSLAESLVQV